MFDVHTGTYIHTYILCRHMLCSVWLGRTIFYCMCAYHIMYDNTCVVSIPSKQARKHASKQTNTSTLLLGKKRKKREEVKRTQPGKKRPDQTRRPVQTRPGSWLISIQFPSHPIPSHPIPSHPIPSTLQCNAIYYAPHTQSSTTLHCTQSLWTTNQRKYC